MLVTIAAGQKLHAFEDRGLFLEYPDLPAQGLPEQRLTIWLPPGYDGSERRYRVLYMHDAQNLFRPEESNFNKVWAADSAMLAHASSTGTEPWIIVGIWSPGIDRYRQYLPLPAYDAASGELRAAMDDYAKGEIVSDRYIGWIVNVLKPWLDRHFRTMNGPENTAIAGSSMGGLISLYAFLEYPNVFSRAACVSTHWPAIDPVSISGTNDDVMENWRDLLDARLGLPQGRKIWFDHGTATLDRFYAPYQAGIDELFAARSWQPETHWTSRVYEGAEHEENAWAERLPEIFGWLLSEERAVT